MEAPRQKPGKLKAQTPSVNVSLTPSFLLRSCRVKHPSQGSRSEASVPNLNSSGLQIDSKRADSPLLGRIGAGGFVSRVRTITASIWASSIVRGVPDRGSSQRSSSRSSARRHPVRSRVVPALANVFGKMPEGVGAVVVDIELPDRCGDAFREVRALHPLLPFVLATRASSMELDALLKGEERIVAENHTTSAIF
jgi:hypothetical protein